MKPLFSFTLILIFSLIVPLRSNAMIEYRDTTKQLAKPIDCGQTNSNVYWHGNESRIAFLTIPALIAITLVSNGGKLFLSIFIKASIVFLFVTALWLFISYIQSKRKLKAQKCDEGYKKILGDITGIAMIAFLLSSIFVFFLIYPTLALTIIFKILNILNIVLFLGGISSIVK